MIDEKTAVRLVEAHLDVSGEAGWSYVIEGAKKHADCWAIGVQPFNPDGRPSYSPLGFEVDEISGTVTQWL